jgi:hypothetical protein
VLNLPAADLVDAVNRLAKTTGSDPVPEHKRHKGYRFEPDKFGVSGFTAGSRRSTRRRQRSEIQRA